jgi:hypothetical protein
LLVVQSLDFCGYRRTSKAIPAELKIGNWAFRHQRYFLVGKLLRSSGGGKTPIVLA